METRFFYMSDDWYSEETRVIDTARYISAFKLRQPIAYVLWYYFRLRQPLTPQERKLLPPQIKRFDKARLLPCGGYMDEFATRHPWLFLFMDAFQFLKKALTTPSQVIRTGSKDAAAEDFD